MSHHEHASGKKLKKLAQLIKNRHTRDINQQAEIHARGRDLEKEREEEVRAAGLASSRAGERSHAAKHQDTFRKLDEIRSKNSHRTRLAQERWNRFAGTEAGGGRGL